MPRTFSRGVTFSPEDLIRLQEHLTDEEFRIWVREVRVQFCPEPGLEEIELFDLLIDLANIFRRLLIELRQVAPGPFVLIGALEDSNKRLVGAIQDLIRVRFREGAGPVIV